MPLPGGHPVSLYSVSGLLLSVSTSDFTVLSSFVLVFHLELASFCVGASVELGSSCASFLYVARCLDNFSVHTNPCKQCTTVVLVATLMAELALPL